MIKSLSQLKNFVHFDVIFYLKNDSIIKASEQMSVNCPKVKSIGRHIIYSYGEDDQYLNVFKYFKQFKRLNLTLEYHPVFICGTVKKKTRIYFRSIYSMVCLI